MRFTRGHTSNATCSPSRAGLMTGRNQQRFGYEFVVVPPTFVNAFNGALTGTNEGNIIMDIPKEKQVAMEQMGVPQSEFTMAEMLKTAGYRTGVVGKWHIGAAPQFQPLQQGFDFFTGTLQGAALFDEENDPKVVNAKLEWDGIDKFLWSALNTQMVRDGKPYKPEEYMTDFYANEALCFIDESKDKPFFLYLAFTAPHTPLQAPKDIYDRLDYIADHKTRVYYAMIESMDAAIGRVMDHLKSLGLEENTLVVFSSDNGGAPYTRIPGTNAPFRGSKATYFQGGVVVPYLVKWPGKIAPGQISSTPVSLLDIYPTVAVATGATMPTDRPLDGVNLLPLLTGASKGPVHQALVWRSGTYKAVLFGDYRLQLDETQKKAFLYNVSVDVGERNNLAESMPGKVAELKAIIEKAETEFIDPIWQTPAYSKVPADTWPHAVPDDAEFVYFPI